MINPTVLPGNVGPFTVRKAVLTPRARRGRVVSFDAATWKAVVQLDGALAALTIKVGDWVNPAALAVDAMVAVTLFNDSNPDDGLVIGTYGNPPGQTFADAEGDPAPVAAAAADGASTYTARRDHVHVGATDTHNHDAAYVNEADHTAAAHDALNIDADTLDGLDSTGFALAAAGVTNGNTHDHNGGDGADIALSATTVSGLTDGQVHKATSATTHAWEDDVAAIEFIIDGGGSAITTGQKGHLEIPFACVITRATLLADQSGSIVIDVWKDTYANFPPTVADTITASAKPTLAAAQKAQDSTLTGWTTTVAAGDVLAFNVDSAATVTRVVLSLRVRKT